ncbi:hypothetical protein AK812_SmicGene48054, partial [Symbiodinium microadriaticum]
MPEWFQNFVANQNGDEEFRNRLREVGKLPPAEEKMPAEMQALFLARFRRRTAMEEAAPDFKVGAKGKKQLVDNKLDTMFRGGKVDNYFK